MPIKTRVSKREISKEDFYQLDYKVMGLAFAVHNDFGRFWDEKIYQRELAHCCIDANLFVQAITYFRGGEEHVVRDVKVYSGSRALGYQKMSLLTPEIAFKISAITGEHDFYEQHLHRLISYTALRAIKWINFNHSKIQFKTIMS